MGTRRSTGRSRARSRALDMAEQMPLAILRTQTAQVQAEPQEHHRGQAPAPALHRQSAHQDKAATVQHFMQDRTPASLQRGHGEIFGTEALPVDIDLHQALTRGFQLRSFGSRQGLDPVRAGGHLGTVPGRRAGDERG